MDKNKTLERIRVLKISCIENDNNIQNVVLKQTNSILIKKAEKKWKKTRKEIIKELKHIEKEMCKC